jgi:frataxin
MAAINMITNDFNHLAQLRLTQLFEMLQEPGKYQDLEVDLNNDILYITLPDNGQYVINKHYPSQQIWLSSPITGASYFSYHEEKFINKNQEELQDKILKELLSYV